MWILFIEMLPRKGEIRNVLAWIEQYFHCTVQFIQLIASVNLYQNNQNQLLGPCLDH